MAQQALSKNVVTSPATLDKVLKVAGSALVFDGKGHNVVDWGFALKGVRIATSMTLIRLPGSSLFQSDGTGGATWAKARRRQHCRSSSPR